MNAWFLRVAFVGTGIWIGTAWSQVFDDALPRRAAIGITLEITPTGVVAVKAAPEGSAAAEAGMRPVTLSPRSTGRR